MGYIDFNAMVEERKTRKTANAVIGGLIDGLAEIGITPITGEKLDFTFYGFHKSGNGSAYGPLTLFVRDDGFFELRVRNNGTEFSFEASWPNTNAFARLTDNLLSNLTVRHIDKAPDILDVFVRAGTESRFAACKLQADPCIPRPSQYKCAWPIHSI